MCQQKKLIFMHLICIKSGKLVVENIVCTIHCVFRAFWYLEEVEGSYRDAKKHGNSQECFSVPNW